MWSTVILVSLILILVFSIAKIYLDLRQKKSKGFAVREGLILFLIVLVLALVDIRLMARKGQQRRSEQTIPAEQPSAVQSNRVSRFLSELQDYIGELNKTDKPQVQLFFRQGLEYKMKGEHSRALEVFRQALDLNLSDKERLDFFVLMGNSEAFLKEYGPAINYYYQAERVGKETGDDSALAVIYSNLGLASKLADDLNGAIENYFNLLGVFKRMGDSSGEKNALANIGFIYQMKGNTDSAEVYHKRSLEIQEPETDLFTQAAQLNNLALTYKAGGKLDSAVLLFEQSLLLFRKAGDRKSEASVLGNIGLIYQERGNIEKALEYNRQALVIDSTSGDMMGQAGDLTNIGSVLEQNGDFSQAMQYYKRALLIFETNSAQPEIQFVRGNIDRVQKKLNK
ncbi:MAG: tetratricopeptide repeat protein [Candidatus Zixiibacteriota bacterium]